MILIKAIMFWFILSIVTGQIYIES